MLKRLKLNRKGQTGSGDIFDYLQYIFIRTPFIIAFGAIFIYLAYALAQSHLDSHQINNLIIDNRIIYSPDSLAYQDQSTGRVYPGVIDLKKAEQASFENAFLLSDTDKIAAKVQIVSLTGSVIKELYINKDWYERWSPLSSFPKYSKDIYQMPIEIKEDAIAIPGIIKIDVINQNE